VLSLVKQRWPRVETLLDGTPLVVVEKRRPIAERTKRVRVHERDVLAAARREGLERMAQVTYAVLERNGAVSIIPWRERLDEETKERPAA
jgi:uncharacterized membrane protein YcaP (DUF421 family)